MEPLIVALAGDTTLAGELFAGDLDTHGLGHSFGPRLREALAGADIVHLNLEMSVTAKTTARAGVVIPMAMHPRHVGALTSIGVKHVSLANNHTLDYGEEGLRDTAAALTTHGIAYSGLVDGAGRVAIVEARGQKVGFVSAMLVDGPEGEPFARHILVVDATRLDEHEPALCALVADTAARVDVVVVSLHFLGDFRPAWRLDDHWRRVAAAVAQAGADVVQFHGAHHVLGIERIGDAFVLSCSGGLVDDFGSNFASLTAFRRAYPGVIPDEFPLPETGRAPMTLAHPEFRNELGFVARYTHRKGGELEILPTRNDDMRADLCVDPTDRRWLVDKLERLSAGLEFVSRDDHSFTVNAREGVIDFTGVDASEAPRGAVRYLDTISTLRQISDYKVRAVAQLALVEGERIVDVGCGLGGDLPSLAEQVGANGLVIGVEASEQLIGEARTRLTEASRIELRHGVAEKLPLEDGSVDAVRFDRVLMHVEDPAVVLREVWRVLRAGGRWVATEPDWDTLTLAASDRDTTRRIVHVLADSFRHGLIGRELPGLATRAGFIEIDVGLESIVLSRFALADQLYEISVAAKQAVASDRVSATAADAWLADLRRRDEEGRFFCSLTGFGIRARKPR